MTDGLSGLMPLQAFVVTHLWQAVMIAAVLALIFALGRQMSGAVRNALAMSALAMSIVLPLATLVVAESGLLRPREAAAPAAGIASGKADDAVAAAILATLLTETRASAPQVADKHTSPPASRAFALPDISLALVVVWAIGAAVMLGRLARDLVASERLANRARAVKLPGRLGMRTRDLALAVSPEVTGPMVAGLLRPRVILPEGALDRLEPADAEALIAHERAHIQRADIPAALAQRLLLAVVWWSPALYWISRRADTERELACDEAAVAATGDAHGLAATLVSEAENRLAAPSRRPALRLALGAAGSRSELGRRVRRLIAFADTGGPRTSYAGRLAFAGLTLAMVGAVVLAPRIVAQTAPAAPKSIPAPPREPAPPAPLEAPSLAGPPDAKLGAEIEQTLREALAAAGIGSDEEMKDVARDASRLGLDIAGEVQRAMSEAMAQSALVEGDWASFGAAFEKSFGPDFEARINAKADAFEAMMETRFGPEFEAKMEAKGREIEAMMKERFGPEFEARMEAFGERLANDPALQARMKEAMSRAQAGMARAAEKLKQLETPKPAPSP